MLNGPTLGRPGWRYFNLVTHSLSAKSEHFQLSDDELARTYDDDLRRLVGAPTETAWRVVNKVSTGLWGAPHLAPYGAARMRALAEEVRRLMEGDDPVKLQEAVAAMELAVEAMLDWMKRRESRPGPTINLEL